MSASLNSNQFAVNYLKEFSASQFLAGQQAQRQLFDAAAAGLFSGSTLVETLSNGLADGRITVPTSVSELKSGNIIFWEDNNNETQVGIVLPDLARALHLNPATTDYESVSLNGLNLKGRVVAQGWIGEGGENVGLNEDSIMNASDRGAICGIINYVVQGFAQNSNLFWMLLPSLKKVFNATDKKWEKNVENLVSDYENYFDRSLLSDIDNVFGGEATKRTIINVLLRRIPRTTIPTITNINDLAIQINNRLLNPSVSLLDDIASDIIGFRLSKIFVPPQHNIIQQLRTNINDIIPLKCFTYLLMQEKYQSMSDFTFSKYSNILTAYIQFPMLNNTLVEIYYGGKVDFTDWNSSRQSEERNNNYHVINYKGGLTNYTRMLQILYRSIEIKKADGTKQRLDLSVSNVDQNGKIFRQYNTTMDDNSPIYVIDGDPFYDMKMFLQGRNGTEVVMFDSPNTGNARFVNDTFVNHLDAMQSIFKAHFDIYVIREFYPIAHIQVLYEWTYNRPATINPVIMPHLENNKPTISILQNNRLDFGEPILPDFIQDLLDTDYPHHYYYIL
jgi:hypothetical protein